MVSLRFLKRFFLASSQVFLSIFLYFPPGSSELWKLSAFLPSRQALHAPACWWKVNFPSPLLRYIVPLACPGLRLACEAISAVNVDKSLDHIESVILEMEMIMTIFSVVCTRRDNLLNFKQKNALQTLGKTASSLSCQTA